MTTPLDAIPAIVQRLRDGFAAGLVRDVPSRVVQLRQLERFLVECESDLLDALRADLGKPATEAYGTELGFTGSEIRHAIAHVQRWCEPRKVRVPMTLRPGSAVVRSEPLGTVLVIAPWNYPVQLTLAPLVAALTAGNTAVLKVSEVSSHTSELLATRLPAYLDAGVVAVVTGEVPATTALLNERFDHILFTGNGSVGKIVMRAAARSAVVSRCVRGIDGRGLHVTNLAALRAALLRVACEEAICLVDGFKVPEFGHEQRAVIDGDCRSAAIAAASVLAKVTRDRYMRIAAATHAMWDFEANVGYSTPEHRAAIAQHGVSPLHRMSFHSIAYQQLRLSP